MDNLSASVDLATLKPCTFFIDTVAALLKWVKVNVQHFNNTPSIKQYGYITENFMIIAADVLNKYLRDIYGVYEDNAFEEPSDKVFECWWHHGVLRSNSGDTACDKRKIGGEVAISWKLWIKI